MFNFSVISHCDFSLINKAAFQAMRSEWAFILFSAVAYYFKYGSCCCVRSGCSVCCLRENAVVVSRDGAFYIFHTKVTHFDCISVEDLTSQVNQQEVNFLDVTLDLRNESYQPYRNPNNEPLYINSHSNNPQSVIRQIPHSINKRISQLSSNQSAFDTSVDQLYKNALHRSNYDANLNYVPNNNATSKPKRNFRV